MKVFENIKQFIFGTVVFMSFFAIHSNFIKDSMEAKQYVQNKIQSKLDAQRANSMEQINSEDSMLAMNEKLENQRI